MKHRAGARETLGVVLRPQTGDCANARRFGKEEVGIEVESFRRADPGDPRGLQATRGYSTVTDFARLRGWSTSVPLSTAT